VNLAHSESADIYGGWVASVLERIQKPVADMAEQFIARFYTLLGSAEQNRRVLERLSPAEFAQLQQRQAQHLMTLISPGLTRAGHLLEAERAGRAHALAGVDMLWLIESYGLYQVKLFELLEELVPCAEEREPLMRILSRRIMLDVEGQVRSFERIDRDIGSAFLEVDRKLLTATNLPDLMREAMAAIGALEGEVCLLLARADTGGTLQIEASFGAAAERYQRAMEDGTIPKISTDPNLPSGQGVAGRAWRSRQIEISDSWLLDERAAPWAPMGRELGFRSGAAVPLLDGSGNSIAVLSLYSLWPGFFSMPRVHNFLTHIQRVLGYAMQRLNHAPVIPMREQQEYRQLLAEGRVTMLYQPIIDLRDGSLCRLEALARLEARNGALISPARFLPVMGELELLQLFEHGLRQICLGSRAMTAFGPEVHFSINLPAEGLGDERYEQAIVRILKEEGLSPSRLQLELLESEDTAVQTEQKQVFVRRLREHGVLFSQDDLGSGHSSLLRMGQYTFDEVKIDQGLVRSVLHKPQRALEFVLYLTRLAHAFHTLVVVEGLEHLGMLEAAAILGADRGQGYGIARPMPAGEVVEWFAKYRYPVDPRHPKTALGAMAGYLLWDMQRSVMADYSDASERSPSANQVVDSFLSAHALEQSPLGKLLRETSPFGSSLAEAHDARQEQVIEYLTEYWLAELHR